MKKNGSALAYVLILLSALLIVCTGVSSYVIGTTKLNKSYSTIIDSNLDLDSAVNVAREYIISEITKKKNTILKSIWFYLVKRCLLMQMINIADLEKL